MNVTQWECVTLGVYWALHYVYFDNLTQYRSNLEQEIERE